jgi:hypothetical protein
METLKVLASLDTENPDGGFCATRFAQPKLHNCRSSDVSVGKRLFSNI